MNRKKVVSSLAILSLISMFLINLSFVAADVGDDVVSGLDKGVKAVNPVLRYILGDADDAQLMFVKVLVFIVLLAILSTVLKRVPNLKGKRVSFIVSLFIAILTVRYLTAEWIIFMWLPNGLLGILLVSLLPFLVFLYFIQSFENDLVKKVGWIAYFAIYAGLAYSRWGDLVVGSSWWQNLCWIYLIVAAGALLMVFYGRAYDAWQLNRNMLLASKDRVKIEIIREEKKLADLNENLTGDDSVDAPVQRQIERHQKKINSLNKLIK